MNFLTAASRKLEELRGVSECELKLRDATNPNEAWGPSGTQMADVSAMSENYEHRATILRVLGQRMVPKEPQEWRQSYKSLLMVEYLIKNGSKYILKDICEQLKSEVRKLQHFDFSEQGKDHGLSVRERATKVLALMNDEDLIASERDKANQARGKYTSMENNGQQQASKYGSYSRDSYDNSSSNNRSTSLVESPPQRTTNPPASSHEYSPAPLRPPPPAAPAAPVIQKPIHVPASVPAPAPLPQGNTSKSLDAFFESEVDVFSQYTTTKTTSTVVKQEEDIFGNFQSTTVSTSQVTHFTPESNSWDPFGNAAPVAAPPSQLPSGSVANKADDDLFGNPFDFGDMKTAQVPVQNHSSTPIPIKTPNNSLSEMLAKQMQGLGEFGLAGAHGRPQQQPQRNLGPSLNQMKQQTLF